MIGGAGFVGSNLTKNLSDDGFEVTVLDSLAVLDEEDVPVFHIAGQVAAAAA